MEYPSTHDFFRRSNTHDLDQDGFQDLYHRDFIHALSHVARRKLACHQLDPYQHAAFQCGIMHQNIGEEEADPVLEVAMEYAGALGTIIFDESCRLLDRTKIVVGQNQFAVDVAVDWLDGRANEALERIMELEGRLADMEDGYRSLLTLGQEQVQKSIWSAQAIATLTVVMSVQLERI